MAKAKTSKKTKASASKTSKGTRRSTMPKKRPKGGAPSFKASFLLWGKRGLVALVVLVAFAWLFAWFVLSNAHITSLHFVRDQILDKTARAGFSVENILVEGRIHSDADALMALINIGKGDPIFSFDPFDAREQIEKMGWIDSVAVQRRLPDTIYIHLKERTPFALWQDGESLYLIDSNGDVISQNNLDQFKELMMVRGQGAKENAQVLLPILQAEPLLSAMIDRAELIDKRRWNVYLDNGLKIKMPEKDIALALTHIMERHNQENILRNETITDIDARYAGRLIVKTKLGKVQDYKAQSSSGAQQ